MVSVVIPTKNGGPTLARALESLRRQDSEQALEIVVVDSGSEDDTLASARRHGARIFEIDPKTFNHGGTRNFGVGQAGGEIVVLMVQDAVPLDSRLVRNLVGAFEDPRVAGVFARQVPRADADPITRASLEKWVTGGRERIEREIQDLAAFERMPPFERYRVCVFDNVCSAVRKSVWQEMPFPETYFGEDIEWGLRVLRAGWKIVYEPSARVEHSHRRSVGYEYRRTYVCHRRLYALFGLHTVPSLRSVLYSFPRGVMANARTVLADRGRALAKLSDLLAIPIQTAASVWAQYAGARDERRKASLRQGGV